METQAARRVNPPASAGLRESVSRALRRYAERDGRGYPDWAIRYMPIVRQLRLDRPPRHAILEIGANENGLARFAHPYSRVIAVDIALDHLKAARDSQGIRAVVADFAHLPFADRAFETIVSVDTLEHVPSAFRPASLGEISRVLSRNGRAAISFPTGRAAVEAEAEVAAGYKQATGRTLRWLEEHAEFGLPDVTQIEAMLTQPGRKVDTIPNANLRVWRLTWHVLLNTWPARGNAVAQVLLRLVTPLLTRIHHKQCYRAIVRVGPSDE